MPEHLVDLIGVSGGMLAVVIVVTGITLRISLKPVLAILAQLKPPVAGTSEVDRERLAVLERRVLELEQGMRAQSRAQLTAGEGASVSSVESLGTRRISERY